MADTTAVNPVTPNGQSGTPTRLYKANSTLRAAVIGVLVCDIGILSVSWNPLVHGGGVALTVVAAVAVTISVIGLLAAWFFGNRQIEIGADQLKLYQGNRVETVRFSDIQSLEKRHVKMGGSKYAAWFAAVNQGQATNRVQLLYEGQYAAQAEILALISQAVGKPWGEV